MTKSRFLAIASLLLFSILFSVPRTQSAEETKPPRATVRVASDSQNLDYEAWRALDGDRTTFWHSQFSQAPYVDAPIPINCGYGCGCVDQHPGRCLSRKFDPNRPFELRVDLGAVYTLSGLRYFPRADGQSNGAVGDYEVYAATSVGENKPCDDEELNALLAPDFHSDGVWNGDLGELVAKGAFSGSDEEKADGVLVELQKPIDARYLVFRVVREIDGKPYAAVAELEPIAADGTLFRSKRARPDVEKISVENARDWLAPLMVGGATEDLEKSPYFLDLVEQYNVIVDELGRLEYYDAIADQTPTPQNRILATDRDPLDVVLRRMIALWKYLREIDDVDDESRDLDFDAVAKNSNDARVAIECDMLKALTNAAKSTAVDANVERFRLYVAACMTRRLLLVQREELDFEEILFVKRNRANYSHICDQFYGRSAMPGGGLFTLSNPFTIWQNESDVGYKRLMYQVRALFDPELQPKYDAAGDVVLDANQYPPTSADIWEELYSPIAKDLLEKSPVQGDSRLAGKFLRDGAFIAPELSFDGKTIAFSWCECVGSAEHVETLDLSRGHTQRGRCYHVFTCDSDGNNLRQVTDGTWNDIDPCFLPNGRVAFISERRGGYLRCGRDCPNYTLFDMERDGSKMRALSYHETNEWAPSVSNDGQILWTRWDYIDRFGCIAHGAWTTTPDGRNPRAIFGNYAPRHLRPDAVLDIRAIPDSNLLFATAGPHHGQSFGSIIRIDPNAPDDPFSPVTRMTPDVGFPESQNGAQVWGTPWPLADDLFLAVADYSFKVAQGREWEKYSPGDYGIYLADAFGNRELIYRDSNIGASTPIPMRPRVTPPVIFGVNEDEEIVDQPYVIPPDFDAPRPQAVASVQNVYATDAPYRNDAKIKAIRVVQVFCMSVPSGRPPYEIGVREASATDSVKLTRRVWGVAPVEEDGSASFYVPANCELYFQTLDEEGLVVQTMRSGVALRPNEKLSCVGCHESRETAADSGAKPGKMPIAFMREPSKLEPEGVGTAPVNFPELVQPILDARCVECHASEDSIAKGAPDLSRTPSRGYYASYVALVDRGYAFTDYGDSLRSLPGKFGARASKLLPLLKDHYGVELTDEEFKRIALWLDMTSNFYGVYEKEGCEKEFRGERALPTLE